MTPRIGFVGIVIADRRQSATAINSILQGYGEQILGRMGLPRVRGNSSVITLIVEMTTDEMGALTGRIGQLQGVQVKSGLAG